MISRSRNATGSRVCDGNTMLKGIPRQFPAMLTNSMEGLMMVKRLGFLTGVHPEA